MFSKITNSSEFNEEHIRILLLYAKKDLLKSPYTNKYKIEEIAEAKRRFAFPKETESNATITESISGLFNNKSPHKPVKKPEIKFNEDCTCTLV